MLRETVELVNGRVEVAIFEEFIYLDVYGEYTDADVMRMTLYLDDIFQKAEKALTWILDATHVDEFMLTPHGTDMFGHWADKIKKMWPGSRAFLIADKPLSYGMSRMYEIKTADERMTINVVHSIAELPLEFRTVLQEL